MQKKGGFWQKFLKNGAPQKYVYFIHENEWFWTFSEPFRTRRIGTRELAVREGKGPISSLKGGESLNSPCRIHGRFWGPGGIFPLGSPWRLFDPPKVNP